MTALIARKHLKKKILKKKYQKMVIYKNFWFAKLIKQLLFSLI